MKPDQISNLFAKSNGKTVLIDVLVVRVILYSNEYGITTQFGLVCAVSKMCDRTDIRNPVNTWNHSGNSSRFLHGLKSE